MRNYLIKTALIFVLCLVCFCCPVASTAQVITTIAGTGVMGYSGDGGPATTAQMLLHALNIDLFGNLYVSDNSARRIRKINSAGIISSFAGNGTIGYSGDGGPATAASFGAVPGIASDASGNIYFTDNTYWCKCVRRVDVTGIITTIAGSAVAGYSGDGGPATAALFNSPGGIAVDGAGNIYVVDAYSFVVRKIDAAGTISTYAGNGIASTSGDGLAATAAAIRPYCVAVDGAGNLYIAQAYTGHHYIRKVNTAGIISTIAGIGTAGFSGDGGPATAAAISVIFGIYSDVAGNVFFGDGSNRIRKISTTGIISTISGSGTAGFAGDGCAPMDAQFNRPEQVVGNGFGDLYITDYYNYRLRKIYQGNTPLFTGGSYQHIDVCSGAAQSINSLLTVTDADAGQNIAWNVLAGAAHGTLLAAYSTVTTGGLLTPAGLLYTPTAGYAGPDTFVVAATDCGNAADTTTVSVTVINAGAGNITGADTVCVAHTATLTNAVAGGTWSSSNTAIATVSSGGIVAGVNTGAALISYTATNSCGTATKTHGITVLPAVGCTSGNTENVGQQPERGVWPNPAQDFITVAGDAARVLITDMAGRSIINDRNAKQISLVLLPPGIYFVRTFDTNGISAGVVKLVKD
jgi:hypothetical protein